MALEFGICGACDELHAVQRTGRMSIHTTAQGERCDGVDHAAIAAEALELEKAEEKLKRAERKAADRAKQEKALASKAQRVAEDPEIMAAFEVAAGGRKGRDPEAVSKLDRKIYATKGVYVVGGGLPTLGRGR